MRLRPVCHLTFAACLLLGIAASTSVFATPITLFRLMPNNSSLLPTEASIANSPTAADEAKNVTAGTRTGGSFSALFSGSMFLKSDGTNDGDRIRYSAGTAFFSAQQVARFNNASTAGLLVWDFDMNLASSYTDLGLFLELNLESGTSNANVYVSYNDADAGLSLDSFLTPSSNQSGSAIQTTLSDTSVYTEVASTTTTDLNVIDLDLDPFVAASDDGLLRIAVGVNGFRKDVSIQAGGSRIDGVLVPEPATVSLALLGVIAMVSRRRA